jgi:hypothetical protein
MPANRRKRNPATARAVNSLMEMTRELNVAGGVIKGMSKAELRTLSKDTIAIRQMAKMAGISPRHLTQKVCLELGP